jgi:hypothetical protein
LQGSAFEERALSFRKAMGAGMHQAAKLQFERIASEYAKWRAVPGQTRSPAPAWWWGPAMDARDDPATMSPELCASLELPPGSSYGDAAEVLMTALATQTSLTQPDEFPGQQRQTDPA